MNKNLTIRPPGGIMYSSNEEQDPNTRPELPLYPNRFRGTLNPGFLLRKFRELTGTLPTDIIRTDAVGENIIKIKMRNKKGNIDYYYFTYYDRSHWSISTEKFFNK